MLFQNREDAIAKARSPAVNNFDLDVVRMRFSAADLALRSDALNVTTSAGRFGVRRFVHFCVNVIVLYSILHSLVTDGAVSTLVLSECTSLHRSEFLQQGSESFPTFATHTLASFDMLTSLRCFFVLVHLIAMLIEKVDALLIFVISNRDNAAGNNGIVMYDSCNSGGNQ